MARASSPPPRSLIPPHRKRWGILNVFRERIETSHAQSLDEGTPVKPAQPAIPTPSAVKAIGIDGAYVRAYDKKSRQEGWFEVIVGKSQRDDGDGKCFAYVHRLEPDSSARMQHFVNHEGSGAHQPVTFLSDGGDTVRQAQIGFGHLGEYVLDWFHISMRFQNLTQLAKGLEECEDSPQARGYPERYRGREVAFVARLILPFHEANRIANVGCRCHESG